MAHVAGAQGWGWPGLGEVQCYDEGMLAALKAQLPRHAPPRNMGTYNDFPEDVSFWRVPPYRRRAQLPSGWCGLGGHTTMLGRALRRIYMTIYRGPKHPGEMEAAAGKPKPPKPGQTPSGIVRNIIFRMRSNLFAPTPPPLWASLSKSRLCPRVRELGDSLSSYLSALASRQLVSVYRARSLPRCVHFVYHKNCNLGRTRVTE